MSTPIIEESLVNAKENIIIHQVNCAEKHSQQNKHIFEIYPQALEAYEESFKTVKRMGVKPSELLGEINLVKIESNKYIVNMFSQSSVRKRPCDKTVYTNYTALEQCLKEINSFAEENNYTIALPYLIGVGAPNGNWQIIKGIIEKTLTVKYNYYKWK